MKLAGIRKAQRGPFFTANSDGSRVARAFGMDVKARLDQHAPFNVRVPTEAQVREWLAGRTVHEACMTEYEMARTLGIRINRLRKWRKREGCGPPWFPLNKRVWYAGDVFREYLDRGGDLDRGGGPDT